MEVQFGRAKQTLLRFLGPVLVIIIWVVLKWLTGDLQHDSGSLLVPVIPAVIGYVSARDADRGVTVRPDGVIQRKGRKETFIPAGEIADVTIQETTGWLSTSVFVEFSQGRFEHFSIFCPRVKKNPERRAALEEKVATARQILNLSHPS